MVLTFFSGGHMIPVRHLSQVEDLKISKENGWSRSFPTHCCDDGQQTSTLHLPRFHWNWHRFLTGYPSFLDGGGSDLTSECGHVDVWTWGGGEVVMEEAHPSPAARTSARWGSVPEPWSSSGVVQSACREYLLFSCCLVVEFNNHFIFTEK